MLEFVFIAGGVVGWAVLIVELCALLLYREIGNSLDDDQSGFAQGDYPNVPRSVHIWDNRTNGRRNNV